MGSGRTRGRRAAGARAGRRAGLAAGACGRRERGASGTGTVRSAMRGLGVLLGQQAVHSVHSACFDPVSTQYCS